MVRKATANSPVGRQARKIASAFAKGRMPSRTRELEALIDDGESVFETLDALVAQLAVDDSDEGFLAQGYHFILCEQLEGLRFQRDRGYDLAIGMIENVQRAIAQHASAGRLTGAGLSMTTAALHHAGIPASAELQTAIESSIAAEASTDPPSETEVAGLLEMIAEMCDGDPFLLIEQLAEAGHGMPVEARANMVVAMSAAGDATAREAAILMLLDPEPTIRAAVLAALERGAHVISPLTLRRLIATRNWLPADLRGRIDGVVRTARAAGVECATWPAGSSDTIQASGLDGSGAQTALIVSSVGRRKCLTSMLFKRGLRDVWIGAPQSARELASVLSKAGREVVLMPVSHGYLDRIVCHGMQLALDAGVCPPVGLLQAAELVGAAHWQPKRQDWRELLAALVADIPASLTEPAAVIATLRKSDDWAALPGLADSWFEDDQDVARIARRNSRAALEQQAAHVLQTVLEERRDRWAELFVWTALWLREADDQPWQEFSILANAIANGHELDQIPVMWGIAANTVLAMATAA